MRFSRSFSQASFRHTVGILYVVTLLVLVGISDGCVVGGKDWLDLAYRHLETTDYPIKIPREQLQVQKIAHDDRGFTHVRLRHVTRGVPVWGEEVIVHLNAAGDAYHVDGQVTPNLEALGTIPRVTETEAISRALEGMSSDWRYSTHDLLVLPTAPPHLAYRVTVTRGLLRNFVFVDAADAKVLQVVSGTMPQ